MKIEEDMIKTTVGTVISVFVIILDYYLLWHLRIRKHFSVYFLKIKYNTHKISTSIIEAIVKM
jgi:hypothetical protein